MGSIIDRKIDCKGEGVLRGQRHIPRHRQPKLKMLGGQCNVTYAILHNYAKRDSRLTAYGGIVLQRFEFVKVCMGRQRLCWKSQLFLYFVNKIYLPCCRVVFFVVCQLRRLI